MSASDDVGALSTLIRSHPFFGRLSEEAMAALLADCPIQYFGAGETLLHQGDPSDYALILLDGQVGVVAQTEFGIVTLCELSGAQLIGDVGVYAQLPRSATIMARTAGSALRIEQAIMMRLCYQDPNIPLHVIQQLGVRLNAFNQAIATYADALSALDSESSGPGIVGALLNPPPELTNFAGAFRKMAQFITDQRQQREEMANAAAIQRALLPLPLPTDPSGRFRLQAIMKPAQHVGGDFFDALFADDDHIVVTIGDVSGKGMPASLFATVCQIVMRLLLTSGENLGATLGKANSLIASANREGMFATFFVGHLDLTNGALRFCNAGHVTPLIRHRDGTCTALEAHDIPLAVLDDATYTEHRANLADGDCLVLCTDGVLEALDRTGQEFGQKGLASLLSRWQDGNEGLAAAIVAEVDAFSLGTEQFDDIACIVLSRPS